MDRFRWVFGAQRGNRQSYETLSDDRILTGRIRLRMLLAVVLAVPVSWLARTLKSTEWRAHYRAASGTLPAWVPSPGFFADVPAINMPEDVSPKFYQTNWSAHPFVMWGGGAQIAELDSFAVSASGHQPGGYNYQTTLLFDKAKLAWYARNSPAAANLETAATGPGIAQNPDGTIAVPHTYNGLQYGPGSWFADKNPRLVVFGLAGGGPNIVVAKDLTKEQGGYSYIVPDGVKFNQEPKGTYPITARWDKGRGWFFASGSAAYEEHIAFVTPDGKVDLTTFLDPTIKYGSSALVMDEARQFLIAIIGGQRYLYNDPLRPNPHFNGIGILDLSAKPYVRSYTSYSGYLPLVQPATGGDDRNDPQRCGMVWAPERDCIFGIDNNQTPPKLIRITPPAGDRKIGVWTSTAETITHLASDTSGSPTLVQPTNGIWNRLEWDGARDCLIYYAINTSKPQVIRPA